MSNGAASNSVNGLSLPAGFYDGILAISASPTGLAKIFALYEPGSLLGVTEAVNVDDSVGGMAWNVIPARGVNSWWVWNADGCRHMPYPRSMPITCVCLLAPWRIARGPTFYRPPPPHTHLLSPFIYRGMCYGPNTLLDNSEDSGTIAGELDYTVRLYSPLRSLSRLFHPQPPLLPPTLDLLTLLVRLALAGVCQCVVRMFSPPPHRNAAQTMALGPQFRWTSFFR